MCVYIICTVLYTSDEFSSVCLSVYVVEWNGMKWNEMEWNGMKWNGMKWNEMEWNAMEWNGMKWNGMICCVMLCFVTLCYVMLSPSLSLFIAISYHYVMLCYIISRHVMLCYLMYGRLSTQDNSQALGTMFHAPSESWKLKVHPTIWYMKPISGELMWIGAKQNQCKSWMFFDISNFSMIWHIFWLQPRSPSLSGCIRWNSSLMLCLCCEWLTRMVGFWKRCKQNTTAIEAGK